MHHPSNIPLYSQSFIDSSIPDRDPQVKKGNKNVLQEIPITNRNMEFFKRSQNPLFLKSDEFSKDILRKIAADKVKRNLNNDYKNKLVKPKNDVKNLEEKINQKLELKNTNFLEEYLDKLSLNESKPNFVPYRELENQNLKNTYSNDIIENLKSIELKHEYKNFLENHKIPPHLRAKMVDWMVEVLCSYKCQDQTFFLSISIMDWFFKKSKNSFDITELHLTGVTSMFIANKYEEIYPLKLATIYEKIAHRKLSMEQIKRKEKEILETLDFNIMFPTPFEYLTIGFQKLNLKNIMPQKNYEYLEKVSIYLLKMMTHDYEIICGQKFHELAAACIFVAFKIVEQLDGQFPLELKTKEIRDIFKVNEDSFFETASKVLNLAKNFEKTYSNLENLKKFNGFSYENDDNKENYRKK